MSVNHIQEWKKFYELTKQVQEAKPWSEIDDGQLIALQRNPKDEPVFVNILGNAGNTYGLVFYKGLDGLNDYNLLRTCEDLGLPPAYGLFNQNCRTIYFGEEEEIPDEEYEAWHEIRPDFENSEYGIPYILSLKKGYFPWGPDSDEVKEINTYLGWFLEVIEFVQTGPFWGVGLSRGMCLCEYRGSGDEWDYSYPPLPHEEYKAEITAPGSQEMQSYLKTAKKTRNVYEADVYYTNIHINDPSLPRPAAAPFVLVADHGTGMILDQQIIEPDDEISLVLNEVVLRTAQNYGIPADLQVRSILFADMLEYAADEMNCRCTVHDTLTAIDDLTEAMESELFDQQNMFS